MNAIQYTVRGIDPEFDRLLRNRARESGVSFNAFLLRIFFPLAIVSAWTIVGNWVCTIAALTTKRSYSQVPLVGGMLGVMACRCGPEAIRPYAWVPLLLDLGTLVVPYTLVWLLVRWVSHKIRGR